MIRTEVVADALLVAAAGNACNVAEDMAFVVLGPPPARTGLVQPPGSPR
jgi:hypothetical protein